MTAELKVRHERGYWDDIAESMKRNESVRCKTHNEAVALVIALKRHGKIARHETITHTIYRVK